MKLAHHFLITLMMAILNVSFVYAQSPGNVSADLRLWLKANAGVVNTTGAVNQWNDQSVNANNLAQTTASRQPSFKSTSELINFNSVVDFDGNDGLTRGNILGSSVSEINVFTVSVEDVRSSSNLFQFKFNGNDRIMSHYPWSDGRVYLDVGDCCGDDRVQNIAPFTVGQPSMGSFISSVANSRQQILVNARLLAGHNTAVSRVPDQASLGGNVPGNALGYNGRISEFITFSRDLSANEAARVHSYLAIKYGISQNDGTGLDYVASNWTGTTGTRFWNATTNSGYNNDVFGIGRDDQSALNQRVSRSINTDDILTMSLDNDFSSNTQSVSRTTTLADNLDFLMAGNNNGSLVVSANTITSLSPNLQRINRIWRIQDSGNVDCVYLNFNTSGFTTSPTQAWYVVVADDASFTTNVAYRQVTVGGNAIVRVNFNDNTSNNFITLARLEKNAIANTFDGGIVGINTQTPANNTYLDIRGGNQGMVITRLNQPAINALIPVEGMLVFNTTTATFQLYNGTNWRDLGNTTDTKFCN